MSSQANGASRLPQSRGLLAAWRRNIVYIGLIGVFLIFAITLSDQGFLDPRNLLNVHGRLR
jgi:ribose transport system permease protein